MTTEHDNIREEEIGLRVGRHDIDMPSDGGNIHLYGIIKLIIKYSLKAIHNN